jgi:serine/threonine-protein kinase RsbW
MNKKRIEIVNNLSELESLVAFVQKTSDEWNLSPKLRFNLNLVLEELVTNTISYGYHDIPNQDQTINIVMVLDDGKLSITITDRAQAFNPVQKEDPSIHNKSIEEREVGGLGIYLVKQLMDEIEYKREDGQNVLVLRTELKD